MSVEDFRSEVAAKKRFEFGENWKNFLKKLDDERIQASQSSLANMLEMDSLEGKRFLDIGSGSGLSSLSARRMGAEVHSFDYDESSVWCTHELRSRYFTDDPNWTVEHGSALDRDYVASLGKFNVVYSWGVLHHTGEMWLGIDNAIQGVGDEGRLFLAIYNDQGFKSHMWWIVKYIYNHLPRFLRKPFAYTAGFGVKFLMLLKYTILLKPMVILGPMLNYKPGRGMSMLSDMVDWYGGLPFEFARYDVLRRYVEAKGFKLVKGVEAGSLGCHEMVFQKTAKSG